MKRSLATVTLSLLLGLGGGILGGTVFAKNGPAGPRGAIGHIGDPGPATSLETNKLGYCFGTTSTGNGSATWLEYVTMNAPVSTGGVLSCLVGTFVPLTPSKG